MIMGRARIRWARTAIFAFSVLVLSACGKFNRLDDGGFTEVKFAKGLSSYHADLSPMVLDGGVMIYAYSDNYVTNLLLSSESDSNASIRLPNGTYSFYAFGYTSSSYPMRSSARCSIVSDVSLNGSSRTITLQMIRSTCAEGTFVDNSAYSQGGTDTNYQNEFAGVQFFYCGTGANTSISGFASTQRCGWGATSPIDFRWKLGGTAFVGDMSYEIKMPIFKRGGGQYEKLAAGLSSGCHYVSTGGESIGSTELSRLPMGSTARQGLFPVEIYGYDSTDCSGSAAAVHLFSNGLIFGPSSGSASTLSRVLSETATSGDPVHTAFYYLIGT